MRLPGKRLPGAVRLNSPVGSRRSLLKFSLTFRDVELAVGRGGRPDKSLLTESCWNERVNVFLGVVGGAGVMLLSLPLNEEATLLDELAPP